MQAWPQKWRSFRRGRCPSEQTIAAYADQQLIASERYAFERHLSNCDRCLQQVGFLARTDAAWHEVPATVLQTALNRTSRQNAPGSNFFNAMIPASAAALIVFAHSCPGVSG
jgi:anti-sigma factor RsiW